MKKVLLSLCLVAVLATSVFAMSSKAPEADASKDATQTEQTTTEAAPAEGTAPAADAQNNTQDAPKK